MSSVPKKADKLNLSLSLGKVFLNFDMEDSSLCQYPDTIEWLSHP